MAKKRSPPPAPPRGVGVFGTSLSNERARAIIGIVRDAPDEATMLAQLATERAAYLLLHPPPPPRKAPKPRVAQVVASPTPRRDYEVLRTVMVLQQLPVVVTHQGSGERHPLPTQPGVEHYVPEPHVAEWVARVSDVGEPSLSGEQMWVLRRWRLAEPAVHRGLPYWRVADVAAWFQRRRQRLARLLAA